MMDPYAIHNQAVARLWNDYHNGRNEWVPITLAFDEQFLLPLWGCTFRRYYEDVETQIDVQLKSQEWIRTRVLQDAEMGLPDAWSVTPAGWMSENEFLGAEIVRQEDDYAWGQPIPLSKSNLLRGLQRINARNRIQECTLWRQYLAMKDRTRDMEFRGRPVRTQMPVASTHGVFTKAAEIRGLDGICTDLFEDPAFVKELLETITGLFLARIAGWHDLAGVEREFPSDAAWGLADDSVAMLSRDQYEEFVLPCHERFYSRMTTGARSIHLCGHAQHLFPTLHARLGVTIFNGPGPQIDLVRMIDEIDAPIEIQAEVAHATLQRSHAEIEAEIRALLPEKVKQEAKLMLIGYAPRATPLENIGFFYGCGKRYGRVSRHSEGRGNPREVGRSFG
jgi:hypothetical protein